MKKPKKVIASKNFPARLPVVPTLVIGISLDYWNAPEWLWGAIGFLVLLAWVGSIYEIATREEVDIFENKENAN